MKMSRSNNRREEDRKLVAILDSAERIFTERPKIAEVASFITCNEVTVAVLDDLYVGLPDESFRSLHDNERAYIAALSPPSDISSQSPSKKLKIHSVDEQQLFKQHPVVQEGTVVQGKSVPTALTDEQRRYP